MSFFHIIRDSSTISLFKDIIQECVHSDFGDTAYISSGFYQEEVAYSAYKDEDSQRRSFANYPHKDRLKINIIGIHNSTWKTRWENFINELRGGGYIVRETYQIKHHAKVFIYEREGTPLLEIIGSSNFTSRAYGTTKLFNTEADLVICNDAALEREIQGIIERNQADQRNENKNIMVLKFDNERNRFSVEEEMIWLRDNMFRNENGEDE